MAQVARTSSAFAPTSRRRGVRDAALERRTAADDIADPWAPVAPPRVIPLSPKVTPAEVEEATLRTGNTSPGANSITVKLLSPTMGALEPTICWMVSMFMSL